MSKAEGALPLNNNLHAFYGRQATTSPIHSVHFYEDDGVFLDSLGEFIGAALGAGGACLVIATAAHRSGLAERLRSHGIDLSYLVAMNRLVSLDAADVLRQFMVGGIPDERRFREVVEPQLLRARNSLRKRSTSVVAFGEMVSVLWGEGRHEAAIQLEQLWDEFAQRHAFSLRCAYPIGLFSDQAQYGLFRQVCGAHHQVIPAESYTGLEDENDRHRMISSLQQKAWTMQAVMKGRQDEIGRLKQVEARLQRSEEFARSILECSADCVSVLDLEGRIDYISPPGLRGLEIDDPCAVLETQWAHLWDIADRPRAEAAVAAAVVGRVGSFTGECATARGTRKWWDVKINPARDTDGHVERLIAISRDITELRMAQKAAIESERQAGAGRMAATIAHEINNPLEAVTNFIFLALSAEGLSESAANHLQSADRELGRAAQITRQMLSFYRSSSKSQWIPVSELIHDVVTIYCRKLLAKQLKTSITANPDLQLHAKDGELRQIIVNLVANAIDASHAGGQIWFRVHRTANWKGEGDGVRITIADNGSGMPPDVQRRMFVPFFTTKGGTGTGIGLWITKCLVEQQGGYVHCRSRQGKDSGTVMTLFLPGVRNAAEVVAHVA